MTGHQYRPDESVLSSFGHYCPGKYTIPLSSILGHRAEDPVRIVQNVKFINVLSILWILGTVAEDDDWRLGGVKPDSKWVGARG